MTVEQKNKAKWMETDLSAKHADSLIGLLPAFVIVYVGTVDPTVAKSTILHPLRIRSPCNWYQD